MSNSIFSRSICKYSIRNVDNWYNFTFVPTILKLGKSIIVISSSKNGSIGNKSISGIPSTSFLFKFSMLLMTQSSKFGFFWPQIWMYEAENRIRDLFLIFFLWNVKFFFFVLFSEIKHFYISSFFWYINCFFWHIIVRNKIWGNDYAYSRKELLNIMTLNLFYFI